MSGSHRERSRLGTGLERIKFDQPFSRCIRDSGFLLTCEFNGDLLPSVSPTPNRQFRVALDHGVVGKNASELELSGVHRTDSGDESDEAALK